MLISYIGYSPKEIVVKGQSSFQIKLAEDTKALDEVVVVGYGIQKKSVVTGAISSVKAEDMMNSANTRPEQALQGKTSGVQVLSSSGAPGSSMKIRIRGYSLMVTRTLYILSMVCVRMILVVWNLVISLVYGGFERWSICCYLLQCGRW